MSSRCNRDRATKDLNLTPGFLEKFIPSIAKGLRTTSTSIVRRVKDLVNHGPARIQSTTPHSPKWGLKRVLGKVEAF